jgi:hypothetical protein
VGQGVSNGYFGVTLAGTGTQLFMGKGSTIYGIENQGGTGVSSIFSVFPVSGQTVLFVVRGDFTSGNDTFRVYVNPTPGLAEPASADATKSDSNVGTISVLGLDTGGSFKADEIRIGTTFADVVPTPEPTSLLLLVLICFPMLLRRRGTCG